MSKKILKHATIFTWSLLVLFIAQQAMADSFTSTGSGDWTAGATWGKTSTPGADSDSDDVTIASGTTVTLSDETLTIGQLNINTNGSAGALTLSGDGTLLTVKDTIGLGGVLNISVGAEVIAKTLQGSGSVHELKITDGGVFRHLDTYILSDDNPEHSSRLKTLQIANSNNGNTNSRYVGNLVLESGGTLKLASGTNTSAYAVLQGTTTLLGSGTIDVANTKNALFNITRLTPATGKSAIDINPDATAALTAGTGQTTSFTGTSQTASHLLVANVSLSNSSAAGTNVPLTATYVGGGIALDSDSENTLSLEKVTVLVTQQSDQTGVDLGGSVNTLTLNAATLGGATLSNIRGDIVMDGDTVVSADITGYEVTASEILITGAKYVVLSGGSTVIGSIEGVTSLDVTDLNNSISGDVTAGGDVTTEGTGTTTIKGDLIMGANDLTVGDGIERGFLYVEGDLTHTGDIHVTTKATLGFNSTTAATVTMDTGAILEACGGDLTINLVLGTKDTSSATTVILNSTDDYTLTVQNLNLTSSSINHSLVIQADDSVDKVTTLVGLTATTDKQLILGNDTKIRLTEADGYTVTLSGTSGYAITGSGDKENNIFESVLSLDFKPTDEQREIILGLIDDNSVQVQKSALWTEGTDEENLINSFDTAGKVNTFTYVYTDAASSYISGGGSLVSDKWEITGTSLSNNSHEMKIDEDTTVDFKDIVRTGSTSLTRLNITGGGTFKVSGEVSNIDEIYFHAGDNYFNGEMTGNIGVGDATLYGTGTLEGVVTFATNAGIHRPGNGGIGTQEAESWKYAGGAKIFIEVSSTGCDLIRATDGNIQFSLNGDSAATQIIILNDGTFTEEKKDFVIMETEDGRFVNGAGTQIADSTVTATDGKSSFGGTDGFEVSTSGSNISLNSAKVSSDGTGSSLTVNVSSTSIDPDNDLRSNEQIVYDNLYDLMTNGNESAGELFEMVVDSDDKVTAENLSQLTTVALTATPMQTQIITSGFNNTVINRTHRVLNAALSAGVVTQGMHYYGTEANAGWYGGYYAAAQDEETRILAQNMMCNPFGRQLWFQGSGNWMTRKHEELGNYSSDAFSFSIGMDQMLCCNFMWGISFGGNWTNTVFKSGGKSTSDISAFMLNLYGAYFADWGYISGTVGGLFGSVETKRHMTYDGSTAAGDHDASLFTVAFEIGKKTNFLAADFNPFLSYQYMDLSEDAFTETGSLAALNVAKSSHASFLQTLGFRFSRYYESAYGWSLEPVLTAAWVHDFCDGGISALSSFAFDDTHATMMATGYNVSRDRCLLSADLNITTVCGREIFLRYAGEFSGQFGAHTFQAGFTFCF